MKKISPSVVEIEYGDTLSGIASQLGTTTSKMMETNTQITNPNVIQAGSTLVVPKGKETTSTKESPFKVTKEDLPQYTAPEEEPTPAKTPYPVPGYGTGEEEPTPAPKSELPKSLYEKYRKQAEQKDWGWFWIGDNQGTKEYYRKEGSEWVQKPSEAEAKKYYWGDFSPKELAERKDYENWFWVRRGGEKRYYRKEGNKWVQKSSKAEAKKTYTPPTPTPSSTPSRPVDDIQEGLKKAKEKAKDIQRKVVELAEKKGKTKVAEQGKDVLEAVESGKPVPSFEIPEATGEETDTGASTDSALSSYDATKTGVDKLLDRVSELEKEAQQSQQQAQKWYQKLISGESNRQSMSDVLSQKMKEYGIPETFESIKTITESMAPLRDKLVNLKEREQQELLKVEKRPIFSEVFYRGEKSRIQRAYAAQQTAVSERLQAKSAQVQALQGNITMASNLINNAVNAATHDEELAYNRIKDFIDYNRDTYNDLKQDEKDLLDTALSLREAELQRKRSDKAQIYEWMNEYPDQFKGVDPSDLTLDEAAELARKGAAVQEAEEGTEEVTAEDEKMSMWEINQFADNYGWAPPYGFTKNQVIQFQKDNPNATPTELERGAKQALVGEETEIGKEFLNEQYFRDNFTEDELKKAAKNQRGFLGFFKGDVSEKEVNEFLTKLVELVQSLRDEEYSDDEILSSIKGNELKVE